MAELEAFSIILFLKQKHTSKTLQRTFKFRLYPNDSQQYRLQNNLAVCRWIYNKFVEQTQKSFLNRNDMNYILTELKQSEPWLYDYHSKMLQMVSTQVDGAQKSLVQLREKGHKTGRLRFARYSEFRTFTYNQSGYRLETHGDKTLLYLSKIGYVEIRKHRETPDNADIKQVTVTKSKSGRWHACITIEEPLINIPKISFAKAVGIDVGVFCLR